MRIRTGRKNPHTLYAQTGPEPADDDQFIGSTVSPEWAAEITGQARGWTPTLFVGGPRNGEVLNVADGASFWIVPNQEAGGITRYDRRRFGDPVTKRQRSAMVVTGVIWSGDRMNAMFRQALFTAWVNDRFGR